MGLSEWPYRETGMEGASPHLCGGLFVCQLLILYKNNMSEIVYILTNEAMPGYVKIGMTNNSLLERMKQLDRTNIPLPFECYYACEVENAIRHRANGRSIHVDSESYRACTRGYNLNCVVGGGVD